MLFTVLCSQHFPQFSSTSLHKKKRSLRFLNMFRSMRRLQYLNAATAVLLFSCYHYYSGRFLVRRLINLYSNHYHNMKPTHVFLILFFGLNVAVSWSRDFSTYVLSWTFWSVHDSREISSFHVCYSAQTVHIWNLLVTHLGDPHLIVTKSVTFNIFGLARFLSSAHQTNIFLFIYEKFNQSEKTVTRDINISATIPHHLRPSKLLRTK